MESNNLVSHDGDNDQNGNHVDSEHCNEGASKIRQLTRQLSIKRQLWSNNIEFVLACIGNAIGLGNIWRFPYLCYNSGGGAFLVAYGIMLLICGFPLLYLEYAVGQWTRLGPVGAIKKLCPLFQGVGLATVVLSFLFCSYYSVIVSWILFYLFQSFRSQLPWSACDPQWASSSCWNHNFENETIKSNHSTSPTREFYENRMLKQTDGIEDFGTIQWELFGCLVLAWVCVYLCVWKGVKVVGKIVYFTALFPFVVMILLLIRGVTLEGSQKGISYFIYPKWHQLKDPTVWVNAAAQTFNSLSIGFGSMISFSSYRARNSRLSVDTFIIGFANSVCSIIYGFAIFSTLGYIAHKQGLSIQDVVDEGPGLVFIVYPEGFVTLKGAPFFSIVFFLMLLCLAIDSQFASVEVLITTIEDNFGRKIKQYMRKEVYILILTVSLFFAGLPNIFEGGIYFFKLIDKYSSGISLTLVVLFETIAVSWCYGGRRLANDIKTMTGSTPNILILICWYLLSPVLLIIIMISSWIDYTPITYGTQPYPIWAHILGWILASLSLICIPIGMVKSLIDAPGDNFKDKLIMALVPEEDMDSSNVKSDLSSSENKTKFEIIALT